MVPGPTPIFYDFIISMRLQSKPSTYTITIAASVLPRVFWRRRRVENALSPNSSDIAEVENKPRKNPPADGGPSPKRRSMHCESCLLYSRHSMPQSSLTYHKFPIIPLLCRTPSTIISHPHACKSIQCLQKRDSYPLNI
jgi:hypothetical protein